MGAKLWQVWLKRPLRDRTMLQVIAGKYGYSRSGDILWDLFEKHYQEDIEQFRTSSFFANGEPQKTESS